MQVFKREPRENDKTALPFKARKRSEASRNPEAYQILAFPLRIIARSTGIAIEWLMLSGELSSVPNHDPGNTLIAG